MSRIWRTSLLLIVLCITITSQSRGDSFSVADTPFFVNENGQLLQVGRIEGGHAGPPLQVKTTVAGKSYDGPIMADGRFLFPPCPDSCELKVEISGSGVATKKISYQRRWTVYMVPFCHIDIGFTQSQRKVLAKNLDNLRDALKLIEQTKDYPPDSKFKFFTEVSWPVYEFLFGPTDPAHSPKNYPTDAEKQKLIEAIRSGDIEVGGFYISHTDQLLGTQALMHSTRYATRLTRDHGIPIDSATFNDLLDMTSAVTPLSAAGIRYFHFGPNTSRYVIPAIFYWTPPSGAGRVLVTQTQNLNGYGENFDLHMRPPLPISDEAKRDYEQRLAAHLKEMEAGSPAATVAAHWDHYKAHYDYPYDIYYLPFYPAHAVDNGEQDITPSLIAKDWNSKYAYPHLVVATPREFFVEAEKKYGTAIPTVRGEFHGYWGDQVFFSMRQCDPQTSARFRNFETDVLKLYDERASAFLQGKPDPHPGVNLDNIFSNILLVSDHNPRPVPFGKTGYDKNDVREWMQTRTDWARSAQIPGISTVGANGHSPLHTAKITDQKPKLENSFYRIEFDPHTGAITSLFDKELQKELAGRDGRYGFNQYVVRSRGENVGLRGYQMDRPGFKRVKIRAIPDQNGVEISGVEGHNRFATKIFGIFLKQLIGVRIPGGLVRLVEPIEGVKFGRVNVIQRVTLPPNEKRVDFTQIIRIDHDQIIDHTFAYPFNMSADSPVIAEFPSGEVRLKPAAPVGDGDLIPAARLFDENFPGINDAKMPFRWMYGISDEYNFQRYVRLEEKGLGVAFASRASGTIVPGPIGSDALRGPFGGAFYHVCVGWTAWGKIGLGAETRGTEMVFESALTSYHLSSDPAQNRATATQFGASYNGAPDWSRLVEVDNKSVFIEFVKLADDGKGVVVLLRNLSNGAAQVNARIINARQTAPMRGVMCTSDERGLEPVKFDSAGLSFTIHLVAGELAYFKIKY